MTPDIETLYRVLESTWPAASTHREGPWTIRNGKGGGQRVAATTAEGDFTDADIDRAETAMSALGQPHLFMIRPGEDRLDALLETRGYRIKDPVVLYLADIASLTTEPVPLVSAFATYPPLAITADLWAAGGIGPSRMAVMDRVTGPKTAILARNADQPAGAAFVAIHEKIAMIHAIEVSQAHRKQGVGRNMLRAAAHWAQDQGATHLALAVTRANLPANNLYTSLGMSVVGHYLYRIM